MPLTPVAQQVCEKRYFQKDKDGNIIEDWNQLVSRVIKHVCKNEDDDFQQTAYDLLYKTEFLPNSPCLVNAGKNTKSRGLSACFVVESPEDCWSGAKTNTIGMIENIANFGHIARQGGGAGIDISRIRPEGDPVFGSTHAKACGPVEHMRMISEVMTSITQSGFRGMAMLACMRVDHPDILKFITCKRRDRALKSLLKEDIFDHYNVLKDDHEHLDVVLDKFLSNFNISVSVTDDFMNKVKNNEEYDLVFNEKIYQTVKARDVFDAIVENAWNNGDPGLLFYDAINQGTYQWSNQTITATNPCFQGDSLVSVADGRNFVSIKQLADEGKDVPVYCCNPKTGDIHIKWGRNPRKTRSNAALCKVTFDDGGQITTTPDHKILLRNGEYVEVRNLSKGHSVQTMTKFQYLCHRSLYNGIVKGDGQSTKTEHKMIYEFYNNELIDEGHITHHRDFDGLNNSINNLQKMSFSEHSTYHRQFNNPMTHWYPNATPEEKQRYHDNMSAATTGEKNGMHGKKHRDSSKQKIGIKASKRFKDEDYRKNISDKVRSSWADDKKKHEHSEKAKKRWQEGRYDNLKSEIITQNCEWCGKEFSRKSLAKKLRFCSTDCGNQIDVSDSEIIDNAINFTEKHGAYPSVSTWETFDNSICSRELIRRRFGNFQNLSERLIDMGVFAKVSPNTKMTFKIIAAAIVEWTIAHGKEPSKKEAIRDICSKQSLSRNGGYSDIVKEANRLCSANSVNHKVVSVEMLDETEDVFNIAVDEFHNLCVFSSEKRKSNKKYKRGREHVSTYYTIVYKNCGEIPIPSNGVCNLGSIDISKFYNENREVIEWTRLKSAIETCIQFLDNVIDANVFPTPDFKKWAKENRPIGLGIMGWADLLLKMKMIYGSEDSFKLAQKVARFFEKTAHEKSVELGKKRGTPQSCRYDELEHRRNVVTLSIAPTGTISLLAGCSSSIEPIFSAITYRYDNTGAKEIRHSYAKKSWFRCASDLHWKEHVGMQAAFQSHIDSSISKTINFSNNATKDDVRNAYMFAWENRCKGITVYRDGCKSSQVLNSSAQSAVGTNQAKLRPKEVEADIFKTTADGFEWHVIVGKVNGVPYEVFAVNGKQELPSSAKVVKRKKRHYSLISDDNEVLIENLGDEEDEIHPRIGLETRRFSLELRHNIDPKHIVAQIDKSFDVVTSFSKAVGRIMKNKYISAADICEIDVPCLECAKKGKSVQMIADSGCWKCPACYNSRCG